MKIGDYIMIVPETHFSRTFRGQVGLVTSVGQSRSQPGIRIELVGNNTPLFLYTGEYRPATPVEILAAKLK